MGANSPNYGKNEEDENMIIKGNIIVKLKQVAINSPEVPLHKYNYFH